MTVNTKAAPRRDLSFSSFEEILAELDRIESGVQAGTATTTGNWSIGEICEHCAKVITGACDGFETRAPFFVRWVARALFFKPAMGVKPMPTGIKLPKSAAEIFPEPGIPDAEGIAELRKELKRVLAGKEMTHPSPVFGKITHDQWVTIHCKHCAMHMGFIFPEGAQAQSPAQ